MPDSGLDVDICEQLSEFPNAIVLSRVQAESLVQPLLKVLDGRIYLATLDHVFLNFHELFECPIKIRVVNWLVKLVHARRGVGWRQHDLLLSLVHTIHLAEQGVMINLIHCVVNQAQTEGGGIGVDYRVFKRVLAFLIREETLLLLACHV